MVDVKKEARKRIPKDTKPITMRLKTALILEVDEFVRDGNYKDRSEFAAAAMREQMRREKKNKEESNA